MRGLIKWLLIAFAGVVALVVVLVAAVIALVDPNDYREQIARAVEEQTGHELVIEGDIALSFYPWLGLDLGRTRLENRPGFGDAPLLAMDNAGIAVRVLPLLRREVVLDTIRLDGLRANLVVDESGEGNWQLGGGASGEPDAPDGGPGAEPTAPGDLPVTIGTIGGVRVTDLHVTFEDRRSGTRHEAGPVNVRLGELRLGEDVALDADWVATLDGATRIEGALEGRLRAASDLRQFRAELADLRLSAFAEGLPEDGAELRVEGVFEADLAQDTARLSGFVARLADLRLEARADVSQLTSAPRVTGEASVPEADLRAVLSALGQEPPETADPDALTRFSLDAAFMADAGSAEISGLTVRLDDTELTGTVGVRDFAGPAVRFDLQADRLNADHYLPPGTDDEGAGAATVADAGAEGDGEPAEIPLEPLRALDVDGRLRLGALQVAGFELTDMDATVSGEDGRIRIHPLGARLYGGTYQGDIRLDATGDALQVDVNERLAGVQAQPLVTQFLGQDLLRGTGGVRVEAQTRGLDPMAMLRELVGEAELDFANGAIQGLNLSQMVRGAAARLRGESAADVPEKTTDFTELRALLTIDRGRVRNDNLRLQSPLFRVEGGGEAALFEQTVDYTLTVNLVGTLEGQEGADLGELRRVPIPLRFTGSLLSPDIRLDLAQALTNRQRERVREEEEALRQRAREEEAQAREQIREEREALEDEVRERAGDRLRRLLD